MEKINLIYKCGCKYTRIYAKLPSKFEIKSQQNFAKITLCSKCVDKINLNDIK